MTVKPLTLSDLTYKLNPPVAGLNSRAQSKREEWLWNGQLHSIDDHPAVIENDTDRQWYTHGLRHRDELLGPAWERPADGIYAYYSMGELHRNNGPAMLMPGCVKWYRHGKLHRTDGPAIHRFAENADTRFELEHEWAWQGSVFASMDDWAEFSKCDPELFVMLKLVYG